jgi:hypothetical protein
MMPLGVLTFNTFANEFSAARALGLVWVGLWSFFLLPATLWSSHARSGYLSTKVFDALPERMFVGGLKETLPRKAPAWVTARKYFVLGISGNGHPISFLGLKALLQIIRRMEGHMLPKADLGASPIRFTAM